MIPTTFSQDINAEPIKRVAAIHDLSCFGRCSLSVIIPALSAMGLQVNPLPTALLSTHTGGFSDFTFHDLTDEMEKIKAHFEMLKIKFNAVYSGFLGGAHQAEIVYDMIVKSRNLYNSLKKTGENDEFVALVDPVMGDDGRFYETVTEDTCREMRKLVSVADIITPNITEACLLLSIPYEMPSLERACEILKELSKLGAKKVVITGIEIEGGLVATACADFTAKETETKPLSDNVKIISHNGTNVFFTINQKVAKDYPGTGDLFASVLLGKILCGNSLFKASEFASNFVHMVMEKSSLYEYPERNGVIIEKFLNFLMGGGI